MNRGGRVDRYLGTIGDDGMTQPSLGGRACTRIAARDCGFNQARPGQAKLNKRHTSPGTTAPSQGQAQANERQHLRAGPVTPPRAAQQARGPKGWPDQVAGGIASRQTWNRYSHLICYDDSCKCYCAHRNPQLPRPRLYTRTKDLAASADCTCTSCPRPSPAPSHAPFVLYLDFLTSWSDGLPSSQQPSSRAPHQPEHS